MPKVSVIISSYNHAPYIGQAIESVLGQDFQDFEIIVTDDASTDDTLEVLARFNDPRLKVFSFTENRKEHMKNEALARSTGEYVAILNSDDEMLPQRLTEQVDYLDQHPDVLAVFSPHHHVDEHGNILRTTSADNKPRHAWLRFFIDKGNRFGHSTAMIRRSFFQQHGPYNRWLILCSDIDLWVRICFRGDIHMLDKPLTAIRQLPNEQNLSGRTPATDNRGALEFPLVLNHYFEEENLVQLPLIFPDENVGTTVLQQRLFLANYLKNHRRNTLRFLANLRLYETIRAPGGNVDEIRAFYRQVAETNYWAPPRATCQLFVDGVATGPEQFITPDKVTELKASVNQSEKELSLHVQHVRGVVHIQRVVAKGEIQEKSLRKHLSVSGTVVQLNRKILLLTGDQAKITLKLPQNWNLPYQVTVRFRVVSNWIPDADSTPGKADKTVRNSLVSRLLRWIK